MCHDGNCPACGCQQLMGSCLAHLEKPLRIRRGVWDGTGALLMTCSWSLFSSLPRCLRSLPRATSIEIYIYIEVVCCFLTQNSVANCLQSIVKRRVPSLSMRGMGASSARYFGVRRGETLFGEMQEPTWCTITRQIANAHCLTKANARTRHKYCILMIHTYYRKNIFIKQSTYPSSHLAI